MFLRSLRMVGDGMNSAAGSSKHSDSLSDSGKSNGVSSGGLTSLPYDVLSRDLTQAKRQLLELHSLVSPQNDATEGAEEMLLPNYDLRVTNRWIFYPPLATQSPQSQQNDPELSSKLFCLSLYMLASVAYEQCQNVQFTDSSR